VSVRPALAIAVATAAAVPLIDSRWIGLLTSAAAFLSALTMLRAWPDELRIPVGVRRRG
jgi:hypothetical protein